MRVRGEEFLLINGWMNYLSLLLAACLGRIPFRPGRAAIAAGLGSGYALLAWMGDGMLRGPIPLLVAAAVMGGIAFGWREMRGAALTAAAGLLLSGGADYLLGRGIGTGLTLLFCGGITAGVCLILRWRRGPGFEPLTAWITLSGRTARLPLLRDSGNLLRCGIAGLPVVGAPIGLLRDILPPGIDPNDLATLPRGWRLLRIRTAAGEKTVMCFVPDDMILRRGRRAWRGRAAVAVMDMPGKYALAPEELCRPDRAAKEGYHAGV